MIGVETINTIQLFYFAKMIVNQKQTTLLDTFNIFKYSTNGYSMSNIFFDINSEPQVGENVSYDHFKTANQYFLELV